MHRFFALLLILMLAAPAAAAPCAAPAPASHHIGAGMDHGSAPAQDRHDQMHGCIGCATPLRDAAPPPATPTLAPGRVWIAWRPTPLAGLLESPATPPPQSA